ncbi:uncharacterized protein [Branchiostoma lanceolatum]|uniref:uncharacterized protein n=1 Tax=Branchiostoma lanceolatum TaxID=7740 RepID=UPI003454E9C2
MPYRNTSHDTSQIQHQGQQAVQQPPQAVYPGITNRNGLDHSEGVRAKEQVYIDNRQMQYGNTSQYQTPADVLPNQSWLNHGEQQQAHQPTWDRDDYPDAARPQEHPSTQRAAERGQTTKEKLASAFKPLADKFQQFKRWRKNKNQHKEEPYITESYDLGHQVQEGMGDVVSHIGHWQDYEGNLQYHGQVNGYDMPPADQQGIAQDWTYEQRQWYQEQARLRDMHREQFGVTDSNGPVQMSGPAYTGQGWNDNSHYGQRNVVNPVVKTKTTHHQAPQQQQWSENAPPNDNQRYGNPERSGTASQQHVNGYHAPVDGNPFNKATWRNYRSRNASEPNRSHIQNTTAQRYERMSQNSNQQDMPARDAQRPNARSGDAGVRRSVSFSRSGPRAHGRTPKGSLAVNADESVQQPEMQTWIGGGRVANLPTGTKPPRYYRNRVNSHSYAQNRPYHQTQARPVEESKPKPSPPKPPAKRYKPNTQPEKGRKNTLTKGSHPRQANTTAPLRDKNQERHTVEKRQENTRNLDPNTRPKTPNPKHDTPNQENTTKPEETEGETNEEEVNEEEERKALKARRRLLTRKPSDAQKSRPTKIPRIPVFLGAIEAGVREEAWNRALVTAEEDPVGTSLCVQLCFYCGVVGSWNEDVVLKKCSTCGTASYCSRKCQWNHWNQHKSRCRGLTTDHQKFKVIIQL